MLFVGQAPNSSPKDPGLPALAGHPARVLASLMNISESEFLSAFDTINVFDEHPGKNGKGDAFPIKRAREAASRINIDGYDLVILLGKSTAAAFGMQNPRYFQRVGKMVPFPHPSGVNRWWNDASNKEAARLFMSSIIQDRRP